MSKTLIAPSILSCDFGHLHDEIVSIDRAGADWVHVDVMDGHYVPNLTIGPPIVSAARRATKLPLDVHLMITSPARWVDAFADAGADGITVHVEACTHLHSALAHIRKRGLRAGVSLNPATSPEAIRYVAADLDLVLVMSVNPGFGGQSFIRSSLDKIREVRTMLKATGNDSALIEVDGGVNTDTAPEVVAAGADVLVAGSAVYKSDDYAAAISALRS